MHLTYTACHSQARGKKATLYLLLLLFTLRLSAQSFPDAGYPAPRNPTAEIYQGINLFTGDVNHTVELASIKGSRISYAVTALYNSRPASLIAANTSNFYNNALGGYGWKLMDYPKLVQDRSVSYLLDGYGAYKLVSLQTAGNVTTYATGGKYYLWKIVRTGNGSATDSWKIVTGAGDTYAFANNATQGTFLQWNLSAMVSAQWSDSLQFSYDGNNLLSIGNTGGQKLAFDYITYAGNKRLQSITTYNRNTAGSRVLLSYTPYSFNSDTYSILSGLRQETLIAPGIYGRSTAGYRFTYIAAQGSGINTGAMDSMLHPDGSIMRFQYRRSMLRDNTAAWPVMQYAINSGYLNNSGDTIDANIYTSFAYDTLTALWDPTHTYACYNAVSLFPGGRSSNVHTKQHPYGSKAYYFFNGQPASRLTAFPPGYNTQIAGASPARGLIYLRETTSEALVHDSSAQEFQVTYWDIAFLSNGPVDSARAYPRTGRERFMRYGVWKNTGYRYDTTTGLCTRNSYDIYNPSLNATGSAKDSLIGVTTYAWQQYPALGPDSLHILNIPAANIEVVKKAGSASYDTIACTVTQWTRWSSGGLPQAFTGNWDEWRSYTMTDSAARPASGFLPAPDPNAWVLESEILQRNESGLNQANTAQDSIRRYVLFSKRGSGDYPVASFVNASPSRGEAAYLGFEPYEQNAGWSIIGSAVNTQAHTGYYALQPILPGIGKNYMPANQSVAYRTGFWYRSTATTGYFNYRFSDSSGQRRYDSGTLRLAPTAGRWRYFEYILDFPGQQVLHPTAKLQVQATIYPQGANADLLIDDISFNPAGRQFNLSVFDTATGKQTATMGMNGETVFQLANAYGDVLGSAGPDSTRNVRSVYVAYSSLRGSEIFSDSMVFDKAQPNTLLDMIMQREGIWDNFQFRNTYFPDSGIVNMSYTAGLLKSNGSIASPARASLAGNVKFYPDYIVHTEVLLDSLKTGEEAGISFTDNRAGTPLVLRYVITAAGFKIYAPSTGTVYRSISIKRQPRSAQLVLEIVDGNHLFAYSDGRYLFDYTSTGSIGINYGLVSTNNNSYFDNFIVANEPVTSKSTWDASGNFRQHITRNGAAQLKVNESLYGGALNLRGAVTRSAYIGNTGNGMLRARGDTAIGMGYLPGFAKYNASTQTVDSTSLVSKAFGYDNPYTSSRIYDSTPLLTVNASGSGGVFAAGNKGTSYNYGSDSAGSGGYAPYAMIVNSARNPDALSQQHFANTDNYYYSGIQVAGGDTITVRNEYDKAMRLRTAYYPNYFNAGKNFYSSGQYNYVGNVTSSRRPDDGNGYYAYDKSGRLYFSIDANGLAANPDMVSYWKYDDQGRVSETGYVSVSWNAARFNAYAASHSYPPGLVWRKKYSYDGKGLSPQVGHLTGVLVNNDQDTAWEVSERYFFDLDGNVIEKQLQVSDYGTAVQRTRYGYDLLGKVISIDRGDNKPIIYSYNDLGLITAIGTPADPAWYATYDYTDTLLVERLNKGRITRVYDLNPAGWVDNITDTFFKESLTYTHGGLDNTGYYSGLIASATTRYNWAGAPDPYTYRYKYDGFGRLIAGYIVETDQNDLNYAQYDDNGNIIVLQRWKDKNLLWSNTTNTQNLFTSNITAPSSGKLVSNRNIAVYGLDIDPLQQKIYIANDRMQFQRSNLDGSSLQTLPLVIGVYPQGLAVDAPRGMLYVAVPALNTIVRAKTDGTGATNILSNVCPQNVAVFATQGRIYWPDGNPNMGTPTITIRSAKLDGTGMQTLITLPSGTLPITGFAVDTMRSKMYWATGGKIQYANLDGSGMTTLYIGGGDIRQISLDIFNKKVFWADKRLGKIQQIGFDQSGLADVITGLNQPEWIVQNLRTNIYSYVPGTNQVSGNQGATNRFAYDSTGKTTRSAALGINTITYDPYSTQPSSITATPYQVQFDYGSNGERVLKQYADTSLLYIHGLNNYPLAEKTRKGSGAEMLTTYVYGPTGLISFNYNNADYFVLKDHLGSVRVVTDSASHVLGNIDYTPFGEVMTDVSTIPAGIPVYYRYTGQEYDAQTGLYNYRARMYDPSLGRFYTTDALRQDASPYSYVANNPIVFTDPSGMFWGEFFSGLIGGATAGAYVGGSFGGVVLPVVGAVPGAVVGAVVGGIGGAFAGALWGMSNDLSAGLNHTPAPVPPAPAPAKKGASGNSYTTKNMESQYVGEDKPNNSIWGNSQVKYLGATERNAYELFVQNGKLVDANGQLFDTKSAISAHTATGGFAIFVMGAKGRIFASLTQSVGKFHHSSFLAGQPVAAAGEIKVDNGVLMIVTNKSGHYRPTAPYIDQFLAELKARGVNVTTVVKQLI